MRNILLLSDSTAPWHSVWIRIGQYAELWPYKIYPSVWITRNTCGEIQGVNNKGELSPPCDGILLYRWTPKSGNADWVIEAIREGFPIIADVDDNLWQAGGSWTRKRLKYFSEIMNEVDAITCSSENLKWMLQAMFKTKEIVRINNCGPDKINNERIKIEPIRIGWTGAPWTRPKDLLEIKELTKWLQKKEYVQLVHIGHLPNKSSMAEILDIPPDAIEKHPLMPYGDYIKHLQFDIGLAPLSRNNFNSFKSDLKVVEYSSQSIAWIASCCDPYEDLCSEWGLSGRLCSHPEDWIKHCKELITENRYIEEGKELQLKCNARRSKTETAKIWQELIEKVFEKKNI